VHSGFIQIKLNSCQADWNMLLWMYIRKIFRCSFLDCRQPCTVKRLVQGTYCQFFENRNCNIYVCRYICRYTYVQNNKCAIIRSTCWVCEKIAHFYSKLMYKFYRSQKQTIIWTTYGCNVKKCCRYVCKQ
jgi:hypothetical protein